MYGGGRRGKWGEAATPRAGDKVRTTVNGRMGQGSPGVQEGAGEPRGPGRGRTGLPGWDLGTESGVT